MRLSIAGITLITKEMGIEKSYRKNNAKKLATIHTAIFKIKYKRLFNELFIDYFHFTY